MLPVFEAPYMKLTRCPVGLVVNVNEKRLMDGVSRLLQKDLVVAAEGNAATEGSKTKMTP
jgi:hypothetical protein